MNIPFNINNYVRVKLTEHGRKVHADEHRIFWRGRAHAPEYIPPKEDKDGWSKWQMWSLMECFGNYVGLCKEPCFETGIEIVTE